MTKEPETGTLAELNVKPGDVVRPHRDAAGRLIKGGGEWVIKRVEGSRYFGVRAVWRGDHKGISLAGFPSWRIVSRASQSDTPKLWRDMTDAEKGALLLAHHEGKVIEWTRSPGDTEFRQDSARGGRPVWAARHAYRVKPEPKPEPKQQTPRIVWTPFGRDGHAFHSGEAEVGDWVLTFETEQTEDGLRPIPITLKFEEHF